MTLPQDTTAQFSQRYLALLEAAEQAHMGAAEEAPALPSERAVQCLWYDQALHHLPLRTRDGHVLDVVSPGWWNQSAGPDFRGAQIAFNDELFTGDVEVHLSPEAWTAHGHHHDARYENVILHVVLDAPAQPAAVSSPTGRPIPLLVLRPHLEQGWQLQPLDDAEEADERTEHQPGACSALIPTQGTMPLIKALELAAEWRMLTKARALRERMDRASGNQALYEMLMYAAGFSTFKHHFEALARQLPYERAAQLAHEDPMLLEAALLQLAGLLPEELPEGTMAVPHFARLRALRRDHLAGLRPLPLVWKRLNLRPANYPERRIAGMARVIARTKEPGLLDNVMHIWRERANPKATRTAFEAMFPRAMGFWADHYTWAGKPLAQPSAPIGAARVHSIIGNVFLPAGLAVARATHDRVLEDHLLEFFRAFPKEADNHIIERVVPRLLGESGETLKQRFQLQQGMLQFYHDWCGPNPSCRNCSMYRHLDHRGK